MASTANAGSGASPSHTPSPASSQKDASGKSNVKQASGAKMVDKARRESPSDANRRSTAPKAWTGTNPISQRTSTPTQTNGHVAHKTGTPSKPGIALDAALSDKQSHDRLKFLLAAMMGLSVILTSKTGDKYEGIFAGLVEASNSAKLTLKMTRKVQNAPITQPNGNSYRESTFIGPAPEHSMSFELRDMADLTIAEFNLPEPSKHVNGATSSFQTDTDISGNASRSERTLQRWVPDAADSNDYSLESTSASGWDQFATHAKMTGGISTYTEEAYTTTIDRKAPDYKKREAEAARIAREIEGQTSKNAHLREERGQAVENDYGDEEDKYSGVRRDNTANSPALPTNGPNKYTPPALRAPSAIPTAAGAPVDPAIVSAQLSRPGVTSNSSAKLPATVPAAAPPAKQAVTKAPSANVADSGPNTPVTSEVQTPSAPNGTPKADSSVSPRRQPNVENPSQGVEIKVLDQFRQFANTERARHAERKKLQANQDRTAKINDLIRFSKTFTLRTPVPQDLLGILAKDPKKQEAIAEKAQRDTDGVKSTPASNPTQSIISAQPGTVPKFDKSQIPPPIPERNTFVQGRGGHPKGATGKGSRSSIQQIFPGAGVPVGPRNQALTVREKNGAGAGVPAPIPLPETRVSTVPSTEQSALSSPRNSNTPISAISMKFSARAPEFKPTAPSFTPAAAAATVPPGSPSPIPRATSVNRAATPSSFFGSRKPKPADQRLDPTKFFDPVSRMKAEVMSRVAEAKRERPEEHAQDFAANEGVPNAYHTKPTWIVKEENQDKTYEDMFRPTPPPGPSPLQGRSGSSHAVSYGSQTGPMAHMGQLPQTQTPQHGHHGPQYGHHFDDHRMPGGPQVYASPNVNARHMSFHSPMAGPAQLNYAQPQYFAGPGGPMQMRGYGNNAAMMHAQPVQMAPMMMAQQSSGPYMSVSPGYGQMHGYPSPSPGHVYPQQNGYPSPGRMAPVMMHQGSQQGHYGGPNMMYGPGGQPMMYGQQGQMQRPFPQQQASYGNGPHQMSQRAMSSGYGQKGIPQLPQNPQAPANAPNQPAAYAQTAAHEDGK